MVLYAYWILSIELFAAELQLIINNSFAAKEQLNFSSRHLIDSHESFGKSTVLLLPYHHVPPRLSSIGTSSINLPDYCAVNQNICEEKLPVDVRDWARDLP